jgi:hypothetical protein
MRDVHTADRQNEGAGYVDTTEVRRARSRAVRSLSGMCFRWTNNRDSRASALQMRATIRSHRGVA